MECIHFCAEKSPLEQQTSFMSENKLILMSCTIFYFSNIYYNAFDFMINSVLYYYYYKT